MSHWQDGVWRNGRKKLTGKWRYWWAGDYFIIQLDGKDKETGLSRQQFISYNDSPTWGKWKLEENKQ